MKAKAKDVTKVLPSPTYRAENYATKDRERRSKAIETCEEAKYTAGYTDCYVAVNEDLKVVRRIVTRSPRSRQNDVWNLADKDKRTLDYLREVGFEIYLLLVEDSRIEEIPYNAVDKERIPAREPYWRFTV